MVSRCVIRPSTSRHYYCMYVCTVYPYNKSYPILSYDICTTLGVIEMQCEEFMLTSCLYMPYSGSLKYSTVERALHKVTNGGQSSSLDLNQFMAFIDAIQGNVKYDEIDIDAVVADSKETTNEQKGASKIQGAKNSNRDSSKVENSPSKKKSDESLPLTLGLQSSKVSV